MFSGLRPVRRSARQLAQQFQCAACKFPVRRSREINSPEQRNQSAENSESAELEQGERENGWVNSTTPATRMAGTSGHPGAFFAGA
jgi:hypothetical protein